MRCRRRGADQAPEKSEKARRDFVREHGPFRIQCVVADPDRSVEILGQGAQSQQAEAAADAFPVPGGFAAEKALPPLVALGRVAVKGHDGGGDREGRALTGGVGKLAQLGSPFEAKWLIWLGGGRRGGHPVPAVCQPLRTGNLGVVSGAWGWSGLGLGVACEGRDARKCPKKSRSAP